MFVGKASEMCLPWPVISAHYVYTGWDVAEHGDDMLVIPEPGLEEQL